MRKVVLGLAAVLWVSWATPALAGGAYCEPAWSPENPDLGCSSQIAISPGNDSRVNLFLLLQDRAGNDGAGLEYPDLDWRAFYGRNFFRWSFFNPAWYPSQTATKPDWGAYGGRCQTLESGRASFLAGMEQIGGLKSSDRRLLTGSRDRLEDVCKYRREEGSISREGGYFLNVGANGVGDSPFAYMVYLEASAAFYDGDWQRATDHYSLVSAANLDPWLTETSRYMLARTALNEAIASADDEWGWFRLANADASAAKRAEDGFLSYLEAYPEGQYASSATGLIRKALWLQKDVQRLGAIYSETLAKADISDPETLRLINEVDAKLVVSDSANSVQNPWLTAVHLLLRMRSDGYYFDLGSNTDQLTQAEVDATASQFADHQELFSFLQANHAFYVRKDYAAVRDLLPDDAKQDSYSPLAFSRQYLRGLALHALKDRNEEGFWRELISGAKGHYQRPAIELTLARVMEQKGRIAQIFDADSPVRDPRIRRIVLGMSAGPEVLKQQARAKDGPAGEAPFALFVALWRQLQHGEYAGFLEDYPLTESYALDEDRYGLWGMLDAAKPPAGLFRYGEVSDGYACPALDQTATRLARNPRDTKGLLCLGDFYRLNDFDGFEFVTRYAGMDRGDELGQRDFYPGDPTPRHDFYTSIIADRSAAANDKAYALYRAIRCYAPSNNNSCGGDGVDRAQRERWFRQIKRDHGNTQWAKDLKYYW